MAGVACAGHVRPTVSLPQPEPEFPRQAAAPPAPAVVASTTPQGSAVDIVAEVIAESNRQFEAARRELLEETGCVAERWTSLGSYVTNGNQYCNTAHLFRADELLAYRLATAHNLTYVLDFMTRIRTAIRAGTFAADLPTLRALAGRHEPAEVLVDSQ